MQRFLEMVDLLKKDGIVGFFGHAKNARRVPLDSEDWGVLEAAQPFVFSDEGEPFTEHVGLQTWADLKMTGPVLAANIDGPFPVFSIEALNGPLAISTCELDNGSSATIETWCVVVKEYAPKRYGFWTYTCRHENDLDGKPFPPLWLITKSNVDADIVAHYLNRMEKEKMGVESVRTSVKLGEGKSKRIHKIRRVIHVQPKKRFFEPSYGGTRSIDWTHRFEVRGHWVSLPGKLGKDREGNYCIKDWTWRSNYIKGAEHLPLVKKTRVVETAPHDDND